MPIIEKITPLKDKILVCDMEFGEERTASGIVIPSADAKTQGIFPRWGRVWAVGDEQKDIKVGEWVLVEHGRWTRTIEVLDENDNVVEVRMVDNDAIIVASDEKPQDVYRAD